MKKKSSLFILFLFFSSFEVYGQERKRKGPPEGFSLGAGLIHSDSPYKGVGDQNLPVPFFTYKRKELFIRGPIATYNLIDSSRLKVGGIVNGAFFTNGYESDDSESLKGMDERKGTVRLGLGFSLRLGILKLRGKLLRDVLGVHNGFNGDIGIGFGFPVSVLFKELPFTLIGLNLGYKYYDKKYINYYYGVKASEASTDRISYTGTEALAPFLNSFIRVKISESWGLMSIYNIESLADEVRDSPIVDETIQTSLIFFLTYSLK